MKVFKNPKDKFIFTLVMLPVTIIAACVVLTIKGVMNIEETSLIIWLLVQVLVVIMIARFLILIKLNEPKPNFWEYDHKKYEKYMEEFKKDIQDERARQDEYQNNKNREER